MKKVIFIYFISLVGLYSQEKTDISISFNPIFEDSSILLDEVLYYNSDNDSLVIESLRFYISNIQLLQNNEVVYTINDGYYLLDLEYPESMNITLSIPNNLNYNRLSLGIGIDSTTNAKGVMGGALDPTKGMYWTWQSGYINFKLEGVSNKCATRKNRFQYHLGGYQSPFNLYQTVDLVLRNNNKNLVIDVDISELILDLDLENINQIMSPNTEALKLTKLLPQIFKIKN
ncbi:MAG: hypothetical protein CVV25_11665 [Ignavibacteriae bacterium HGW-Ignavibacteriae-4]|jgi:hypothetical protein|nr:MAG: hypothetical protein CVV25_11665 [Ignavibacteriae bacterium HGW-Ignavibacteriae-4]